MHHGIPWVTVQMMLIDAPSYTTDEETTEEFTLTDSNADELMAQINALI